MRLYLDEDGGTGDVLAVPLGERLKKLQMLCDARVQMPWQRRQEARRCRGPTCSLVLVGDTSTLHLERSDGGAEYVFLPASKPSLGSSSPAQHPVIPRRAVDVQGATQRLYLP
jgi:hypothetical protein